MWLWAAAWDGLADMAEGGGGGAGAGARACRRAGQRTVERVRGAGGRARDPLVTVAAVGRWGNDRGGAQLVRGRPAPLRPPATAPGRRLCAGRLGCGGGR